MSKVFYNSISELGNAFGVNLELPEHINSDTQWLCYVATCRIGLEYISFLCEYKIVDGELYFFRKEKDGFTKNLVFIMRRNCMLMMWFITMILNIDMFVSTIKY